MKSVVALFLTIIFVAGAYSCINGETAREKEIRELKRDSIELAEEKAEMRKEYEELKQEYQREKAAFQLEQKALKAKKVVKEIKTDTAILIE